MPKLTISGRDNLQRPGFYMPNRLSAEAACALHELLDGRVSYLVDEHFPPAEPTIRALRQRHARLLSFDFRQSSPRGMRELMLSELEAGRSLIFLPGEPARLIGTLSNVPSPFLQHLGSVHIAPVPVFLGYYGESLDTLSSDRNTEGRQQLCILPKLAAGPQAGARLLAAWLEQSAAAFNEQQALSGSLTEQLVRSMRRHPDTPIIDGMTGKSLSFARALGVALLVARRLKRDYPGDKRIGLLLPPSAGAVIATLACLIAGITPVMLNYASSHSAFTGAVRRAELRRFITARAFREKLPQLPWPDDSQLIYIEKLIASLSKAALIGSILMARSAPAGLLSLASGAGRRRDRDEAVILFTSGSSGEPKGVVLTHRMLLANVAQSAARLDLHDARFLSSLPLFHSFGLTVTMLLPLLMGRPMCTHPNPTEARSLCELVRRHRLTLICATPTFARAMLRRARDDSFASVKQFIVGAEKLRPELAAEYRERFGVELLEGYGLTEASPVCSVNLPDEPLRENCPYYIPGRVAGSVGAPLPGIAVRLTAPDDDNRLLPLTEQGMIWLKGANIFDGYLGLPELNAAILRDGWYKTGDLGRLDLNGFITLDGRLARFSKIGGEMVPHEGVEQALARLLKLSADDGIRLAVTGVADAQKGEVLALLSTLPEHRLHSEEARLLAELRDGLSSLNIPNLWAPKHIIPVEEIPLLPTGKLDLRACRLLAEESLRHPAADKAAPQP